MAYQSINTMNEELSKILAIYLMPWEISSARFDIAFGNKLYNVPFSWSAKESTRAS